MPTATTRPDRPPPRTPGWPARSRSRSWAPAGGSTGSRPAHAPIAFLYATFKKYADDEGSRLAALLAYYTFLSLFPLAIAGFAVLNRSCGDNPQIVIEPRRRDRPARSTSSR